MVLRAEYKADLVDQIFANVAILASQDINVPALLLNGATIDEMWASFQKGIEEYDLSKDEAFRSAVEDVLHKKLPESLDATDDYAMCVVVVVEEGRVRDVLVSDKQIHVEIIDRDANDTERETDIQGKIDRLEDELKQGTLFTASF